MATEAVDGVNSHDTLTGASINYRHDEILHDNYIKHWREVSATALSLG